MTPRPFRPVYRFCASEPSRARRRRLNLQSLEDRAVPTIYTVTSAADAGPGTLRDAITQANAAGGANEIDFDTTGTFATPQTITLASALPTIASDLIIIGDGPANLAVDGAAQFQVLNSAAANLTLSGFTIQNGLAANANGGGLLASGDTVIDHMVFTGNRATGNAADQGCGAAIGSVNYLNLTVTDTTISGNTAQRNGGAIYFFSSGSLRLSQSTLSGNQTTDAGVAGLYGTYSYIGGGAIYFFGTATSFQVINSTIVNNTSAAGGGGIKLEAFSGPFLVQDSTITGNAADTTAAGYGGGGISGGNSYAPLTIQNSVVSGNTSAAGPDILTGGTVGLYASAVGSTSGFTPTGGTYLVGSPASLGLDTALADNGGPTQTLKLLAGSSLINAGDSSLVPVGTNTDQRGFVRTYGAVDIGAVEDQPPGLPLVDGRGSDVSDTDVGANAYQFTVTFSDPNGTNKGIKAGSFAGNPNAVVVTGPNGFSAPAQYVSADFTTDGTPRTVTYQITPPGGSWDFHDNGTYVLTMQPNQVFDLDGNPIQPGPFAAFNAAMTDTSPVASATAPDVTAADAGAGVYQFTVTYSDPNGTNNGVTSFVSNDNAVVVTGPNGFSAPAQYVSADDTSDGTPRTVTYQITPPGGSWDIADFGTYTVTMQADQVFDLDGNPVSPGPLTTFTVNLTETLVVTNADDSGTGSLRDAIDQANASLVDDVITFDPTFFGTPRTITLQSALPTILPSTGNLTITGPGAALLTVSGGGAYQVFNSYAPDLTMSGFTVTGGLASNANGGGLIASGIVTLDHMVFTGNSATGTTGFAEGGGGAIAIRQGDYALAIIDSTISGNTAAKNGGGIFIDYISGSYASLQIEGSTISGNTTSYAGLYAGAFGGGGIFVAGVPSYSPPVGFTPGAFAIVNSTIANNTTTGSGGGVWANGLVGTLLVQDSTVSGNTAAAAGSFTVTGYYGYSYTYQFGGGGVGALTVSVYPFGIFNAPSLTVVNSVVSGNADPAGDNDIGNLGYTYLYYSAVGDGTGFTASAASTGNLPYGLNPLLGPLQDNGGPTLTMAPLAGSPLLNAGSDFNIPAGVTTDQRGLDRLDPTSGTVDIGAVEVQPAIPTITVDPAQADPTSDNSRVTFDVTFDQPVTGFARSQISLAGSTATGTLTAAVSEVDASHYTVTVTGIAGDGTVEAAVLAGTGTEGLNGSGQPNAASAGSATVTVDTTPPSVTVNQDGAQADPTNANPIAFLVAFSEPVGNFTAGDVTLGGTLAPFATVTGFRQVGATNSYAVEVTINGSHTGTITASVAAGVVTDPAGNANTASTSADNSVTFDNQPPTVTVTPAAGQGATVGGTAVVFDVAFSEPVPAFSAAAVDLTGTTAPGAAAGVTDSGDHIHFTVTVSGMTAGGTVAMTVDAGTVDDPAGNPNVGSNTGSVTYIHSGSVQFSAPTYSIDEEGSPILSVVVTRAGGSDGPLSVDYATADGTAVAGNDYTTEQGTLSWAPGVTTSQTILIPILDDGGFEPSNDFTVALSHPSLAGAVGNPGSATVTIVEEAGLGFTAANFVGLQPDGTALVTVSRVVNGTGAVSVQYATSDGTAVAGRDYTAASGTLSWADGDMADKTITIPMLDDGKSHGRESVHLTLSNPTGIAVVGPLGTATLSIAPNHGITVTGSAKKPSSTFPENGSATDDQVTVTLGGKVGTLTYYLTDGVGPISEIDLAGTDPTKSTVTIAVKKPKGGTGDGRVTINEVDGTGLKSFTATTADLDGSNGNGFDLTGFLGTLKIGSIENGADLNLAGPVPSPKSATTIATGVIGDGTDITVVAPLKSLTAIAVGQGAITAPGVGSIRVTGRRATKTVPGIAGDFQSDVTISGQNVDPVKGKALGSLSVAGAVSGATISVGGNVGSVSVGSFLTSELFAGYSGPDDGSGTFSGAFTVGPFVAKAKTHGFGDSYVIATNFKTVSLASADTANGSVKFGFDFHGTFGGLSLTTTTGKVTYNKKTGGTQPIAGDLEVQKV